MIAYELLPEDQIQVGALALVRMRLTDADKGDRRDFWTMVIVSRVKTNHVELAPAASPYSAAGLSESLILKRRDKKFPLYKMIVK